MYDDFEDDDYPYYSYGSESEGITGVRAALATLIVLGALALIML